MTSPETPPGEPTASGWPARLGAWGARAFYLQFPLTLAFAALASEDHHDAWHGMGLVEPGGLGDIAFGLFRVGLLLSMVAAVGARARGEASPRNGPVALGPLGLVLLASTRHPGCCRVLDFLPGPPLEAVAS